jgi:sugar-specific transcriptional regulator TrmB
MDLSVLEPLDLNKNELVLYKAVLLAGQMTPTEVAKVTNLKRTTAYSVARSLVEKGLLIEDTTRRPAVFALADAEQVLTQIEKEKKLLVEREESYKKIAAEISKASVGKEYAVPTVRFVEESKMDAFLKQQSSVWNNSGLAAKEHTWWGFQDHTFVEHFSEWIMWFWDRWHEKMDLKLLSNRSATEVNFAKKNEHISKRNIKFWGEALDFYSTTWIVGDYVIMINTRTHPFYLVEIHDKLMAHDQREVFKNLWEMV